ncbi:MAG: NADPH-dependent F420 reductase [Gammaproteobacteria bacterium]|nr:NADPH-dependent F420 reductase [Gammaproteobacteria bacterium]
MTIALPRIAIIGGTGALGSGLAYRWASKGYRVVIGSRTSEKGEASAAALRLRLPSSEVTGTGNRDAASQVDIVVLTVPYSHHGATLKQIKDVVTGKIVVDATVPLVPPKVARVQLSDDWPVAKTTQTVLGDNVKVVSAFHNVAAAHLQQDDHHNDGDVLVYGNSNDARETVISLVEAMGLRGWHAGPIDNSVVSEALTSVLIFINKKYKIDGAGIRITGGAT